MDGIRMNYKMGKRFEESFEEYVVDMKARNLRQGTISGMSRTAIFKYLDLLEEWKKLFKKGFFVALLYFWW